VVQSTLVENRIDDGRRFLERFVADGNAVQAAFWVKTAATDLIDRAGPAAAYRAVNSSLEKLGELWLSSSEIKVVGPANPIARDVLAIMARHPGRLSTRFGGKTLGSMELEQTYIYPPQVFTLAGANPMTREDIGREILRIMNRGPGILEPSRVILKDGAAFNGVPLSLQFGSQKAIEVQFIADGEAAPRVVRLDEIASID
jgi:hypothetical protein